jgi:hypothetical protein
MKPDKATAIKSINPTAKFSYTKVDGVDIITWYETTPISDEDINSKLTELQTEYDSLAYARKRESEYPPLKEFAEAYTEKEFGGDATKMDAYKIKYEKVRSDNPK